MREKFQELRIYHDILLTIDYYLLIISVIILTVETTTHEALSFVDCLIAPLEEKKSSRIFLALKSIVHNISYDILLRYDIERALLMLFELF